MTLPGSYGNADPGFPASAPSVRDADTNAMATPMLTIASHPDPTRIGAYAHLKALHQGGVESLSRHKMPFFDPKTRTSTPLKDPFLSRDPITFSLDARGDLIVDLNKCRTECKLDGLSMVKSRKVGGRVLSEGVSLVLAERVTLWLHLGRPWDDDLPKFGMIGEGSALDQLCREIQRVVDLDMTILLRGSLGSGKEMVARTIHENGHRSERPFVVVKLSEPWSPNAAPKWFGAAKGTDGKNTPVGYFTRAHRGTLFLDEISDAHPELQTMLLRVLQTGKYLPVGASTPRRIDFRIIAATNKDLASQVEQGKFLDPLYQRLTGYAVSVPSLMDRREDIGRLFYAFALQSLEDLGLPTWVPSPKPSGQAWLPPNVMLPLLMHSWPGNMRQLRNLVRQLIVGSRGQNQLAWTDAAAKLLGREKHEPNKPMRLPKKKLKFTVKTPKRPADITEDELLTALRRFRWNFKAAAAGLGISRASLYQLASKCKRIRKADALDEAELRAAWTSFKGDLDQLTNYFAVSRLALRHRLKSMGLE